jgi:hypothetical protein
MLSGRPLLNTFRTALAPRMAGGAVSIRVDEGAGIFHDEGAGIFHDEGAGIFHEGTSE